MSEFMATLCTFFDYFAYTCAAILLMIILSHILSSFFGSNTPLKLDRMSFVVITGGCMGIGKEMALELTRKYGCRLLIVDIRKDLFDETIKDI